MFRLPKAIRVCDLPGCVESDCWFISAIEFKITQDNTHGHLILHFENVLILT